MSSPAVYAIKWTETALDLVAAIPVGRRKQGDTRDIYELAKKLLKQRLLR